MKKLISPIRNKGQIALSFDEKPGQSIKEIFDEVCEHPHINAQSLQSPFTIHNVLSEINNLHVKFPSKPICLVSSWNKWELVSNINAPSQVVSRYITAAFVIKDEAGDASFGEALKSKEIITDNNDYVLETVDRVFILIGSGFKKTGVI